MRSRLCPHRSGSTPIGAAAVNRAREFARPDDGGLGVTMEVRETATDPEWDAFVAAADGGDITQTSAWAQLKGTLGFRPVRILVRDDESIVGGAQVLVKSFGVLGAAAYSPKAPLLRPDVDAAQIQDVVAAMTREVRMRRVRHFVLQPAQRSYWVGASLLASDYVQARVSSFPSVTVFIDLSEDEEAQFATFRRSVRRNIRRTLRAGGRLREGTYEDIPRFHRLHAYSAERNGFRATSQEYLEHAWNLMHPQIRLFFYEVAGEPLAGVWVSCFAGTMTERLTGWSGDKHLRPNESIRWELMRWARTRGVQRYDMGGIAPAAAEAYLQGDLDRARELHPPSGFKLGFGAVPTYLPAAWELIPNPARRAVHRSVFPLIDRTRAFTQVKRRVLQSG